MAIKTYGTIQVDWEQCIDFDRLYCERFNATSDQVADHHYLTATGSLPSTHTHEPVMSARIVELVTSVRC